MEQADLLRQESESLTQFNVLHPDSGNKIDFMLPRNDTWGRTQLSRRRKARLLKDRDVDIAALEDIIIDKMWYYAEGGSE